MTSLQHSYFMERPKNLSKTRRRPSKALGTFRLKIEEFDRAGERKQVILDWTSFMFTLDQNSFLQYGAGHINLRDVGRVQLKGLLLNNLVREKGKSPWGTLCVYTAERVFHLAEEREKINNLAFVLHQVAIGFVEELYSRGSPKLSRRGSMYSQNHDFHSKSMEVEMELDYSSNIGDADGNIISADGSDNDQKDGESEDSFLLSLPEREHNIQVSRHNTDSKIMQVHLGLSMKENSTPKISSSNSPADETTTGFFAVPQPRTSIFRVPTRDFADIQEPKKVSSLLDVIYAPPVLSSGAEVESIKREIPVPQEFYNSMIPQEEKMCAVAEIVKVPLDSIKLEKIELNPPAKKYIPPHLRGNGVSVQIPVLPCFDDSESEKKDVVASPKAYVPPHLRSGAGVLTPVLPPNFSDDEPEPKEARFEEAESFGKVATIGARGSMEDFDTFFLDLKPDESVWRNSPPTFKQKYSLDIYAVFDGHCGIRAAQFCKDQFIKRLSKHQHVFDNWPKGVEQACKEVLREIDQDFVQLAAKAQPQWKDGSCVIIVLIAKDKITQKKHVAVVNLGDSRAIIVQELENTVSSYVPLSFDHEPIRDFEFKRIERVGGWISDDSNSRWSSIKQLDVADVEVRERATRNVVDFKVVWRVNAELAVARSIGDMDYKAPFHNQYQFWQWPPNWERKSFSENEDLVSSEADVLFHDVNEATDKYLVVGCDGLYDTLKENEIADMVLKARRKQDCMSLRRVALKLVNTSLRNGSSDNITCFVIKL